MHELPQELANSLRSWRGSVYRQRASMADDGVDIEKGLDVSDHDSTLDSPVSQRQRAVVLHPTKSTLGLHEAYKQHRRQQSEQPLLPDEPHAADHPIARMAPHTASTTKASLFGNAPHVADPDPASSRQEHDPQPLTPSDFYELLGIRTPDSRTQNPDQLRLPHGLYSRVYHDMQRMQTKYRIFDVVAYVFLILQVLLSAVFIILGSLRQVDTHLAIAILGAFSTVIAGALALMKGQGLPNRLRQARDSLRDVIFEADELYWDVRADRPVFYKDIKKLREDYLRVITTIRSNHPDVWTAPAKRIAQGIIPQSGSRGQATVKGLPAPVTAPLQK